MADIALLHRIDHMLGTLDPGMPPQKPVITDDQYRRLQDFADRQIGYADSCIPKEKNPYANFLNRVQSVSKEIFDSAAEQCKSTVPGNDYIAKLYSAYAVVHAVYATRYDTGKGSMFRNALPTQLVEGQPRYLQYNIYPTAVHMHDDGKTTFRELIDEVYS